MWMLVLTACLPTPVEPWTCETGSWTFEETVITDACWGSAGEARTRDVTLRCGDEDTFLLEAGKLALGCDGDAGGAFTCAGAWTAEFADGWIDVHAHAVEGLMSERGAATGTWEYQLTMPDGTCSTSSAFSAVAQ